MPSPSLSGFAVRIVVGIADLASSNNRGAILTTYSLGSCLGVTVYDPAVRAGGLLHIMLPTSELDPQKAADRPAMFVDTGIALLLREVGKLGVSPERLILCVAGGAQFLDTKGFFNIGKRNYESLCETVLQYGLKIHAESIGGLVSRSLFLYLETGEVRVKISGQTAETVLWKNSTTL
jgi:chemotaxis protein CheD